MLAAHRLPLRARRFCVPLVLAALPAMAAGEGFPPALQDAWGDFWLFRFFVNAAGYASIVVPGFLLIQYFKRKNYLETGKGSGFPSTSCLPRDQQGGRLCLSGCGGEFSSLTPSRPRHLLPCHQVVRVRLRGEVRTPGRWLPAAPSRARGVLHSPTGPEAALLCCWAAGKGPACLYGLPAPGGAAGHWVCAPSPLKAKDAALSLMAGLEAGAQPLLRGCCITSELFSWCHLRWDSSSEP